MEKQIWVDFSEEANKDYIVLQKQAIEDKKQGKDNTFNIQLLKAINREKDNLKINPQHGTHIPRKYISKSLIKKYGTNRLWKIDLVGFWRMLYTITGDQAKIIGFVLDFMNHKKYNKLFGYKKR